jgi:hypothetical protein
VRYIASPDWTERSSILDGLPPRILLCTVIETGFVSDKFLAFISLVYLLPSPVLLLLPPPPSRYGVVLWCS